MPTLRAIAGPHAVSGQKSWLKTCPCRSGLRCNSLFTMLRVQMSVTSLMPLLCEHCTSSQILSLQPYLASMILRLDLVDLITFNVLNAIRPNILAPASLGSLASLSSMPTIFSP